MTKICRINGHKYTFEAVHKEFVFLRGYNKKKRKWAWLHDKFVQFDDEDPIVVEWIS